MDKTITTLFTPRPHPSFIQTYKKHPLPPPPFQSPLLFAYEIRLHQTNTNVMKMNSIKINFQKSRTKIKRKLIITSTILLV